MIGFEALAACKDGLPVVSAVTMILPPDQPPVLAHVNEVVYNKYSTNTLSYHGVFVDSASQHQKHINGLIGG